MAAGEYLSAKAELELAGSETGIDEAPPLEKGFAMFVAFTLFGCMPLAAYIVSALIAHSTGVAADRTSSFLLSTFISAMSLFGLGAIKSRFGAGVPIARVKQPSPQPRRTRANRWLFSNRISAGDWLQSGAEVMGIGGVAATVAYVTAGVIDKYFG